MLAHRGFTLIELMVTLAVLGIIASMAAPAFSKILARQNLNQSTQALAATLRQARSQAQLNRSPTTVNLNSAAANTSTTLHWQPYAHYATDNAATRAKNIQLTSTPTSFVFLPGGYVENISGPHDIVICHPGVNLAKTISISRFGILQFKADQPC